MSGIVGLYSSQGQAPHRQLWPALVNHLRHRGPDEGGWWSDGGCFLGHRRLTTVGGPRGQQPMATADGRLVLVCDGAIYNHIELKRELERDGFRFRTDSDAEVLLHGYLAWGEGLARRLEGMFAFALIDRQSQELLLVRDRFGQKPLLFWKGPSYFAFASELRPLVALPELPRQLDLEGLGGFLTLNYVPGTRTLLEGVQRLGPGQWLKVGATIEQGTYYQPPHEACTQAEPQATLEQLGTLLDRAVSGALQCDVPLGVLLSGGVDSALVAESGARQGRLNQAFFLDFEEPGFSRKRAVKEVCRHLGLKLETLTMTPKMLEYFPALVEFADEPLADPSALAFFMLSKLAADTHRVVLSGDGADELFAGSPRYWATLLHKRLVSRLPARLRRQAADWAGNHRLKSGRVNWLFRLARFLRAAPLESGLAHYTWRGSWLPAQAATMVAGGARQPVGEALVVKTLELDPNRLTLLDLQKADLEDHLPNDVLARSDHLGLAAGVETRNPFLYHELASWALALPDRYKAHWGGRGKTLLRSRAQALFGKSVASGARLGLSFPVHAWLLSPEAEPIRDALSPSELNKVGVLDLDKIQSALNDTLAGERAYGPELWGLAVLSTWYGTRVARPPAPPRTDDVSERVIPLQ